MAPISAPLLTTKLYLPPTRAELVSRPRLVERLNAGVHRKLTLISAPAGFGKTTLISEWADRCDVSLAWVSLDRADNDPTLFWTYVIAALQATDPTVGETMRAALQSPQPPPLEVLLTSLINDVTAMTKGREPQVSGWVLVLDDYHVIEAEAVHSSLNFLLDHLQPGLHVVVATREDPPLSLPRRRGRGELAEIGATDLRFTPEETAELFNTIMGLGLSAEDISILEERTEGWIVGLQMAATSLQGRNPLGRHRFVATFAGDDRYVVDYLLDEVLQHQPARIQTFLMQTAVLERLCASLCDALTGRGDGQALLHHLEDANLFIIPLDNRRH